MAERAKRKFLGKEWKASEVVGGVLVIGGLLSYANPAVALPAILVGAGTLWFGRRRNK